MSARVVIGIDPGNCSGLAFGLDKRLVWARAASPESEKAIEMGFAHIARLGAGGAEARATVEIPKVYPQRARRKGTRPAVNPDNLITLAITAGRWIERVTQTGTPHLRVEPRAWKGTLDGDAFIERIKSRLDASELAIVEALALPAAIPITVAVTAASLRNPSIMASAPCECWRPQLAISIATSWRRVVTCI